MNTGKIFCKKLPRTNLSPKGPLILIKLFVSGCTPNKLKPKNVCVRLSMIMYTSVYL